MFKSIVSAVWEFEFNELKMEPNIFWGHISYRKLKLMFFPHCARYIDLYWRSYNITMKLYSRLQRLEESLRDEPEEQKSEKRAQHAVKETEFLRLKRSKLGVDDFDPIKVIGRGAFGEVIWRIFYDSMYFIAQTSAHYWYRYRSCLRLIICFWGTRKSLFYFWKSFSHPPKMNYQMSTRPMSISVMGRNLSY